MLFSFFFLYYFVFSNIKFNFFYLKLFISDRSLSGEKVAFLSCDQEPETLVAIFAQQLAEGGEFLPNKELEAHRNALERLSLEINDSHHFWSQESFRAYWMELKRDGFTLLVVDHLSSVQGQFF